MKDLVSVNNYRKKCLAHSSKVKTFRNSWDIWKTEFHFHMSIQPTAQEILNLGRCLSNVFRSNSTSQRTQSNLSGGGVAWECLVEWYLNLILWNTPFVAVRNSKKFVPQVIRDALLVTSNSKVVNSDTDIVIFNIPSSYQSPLPDVASLDKELRLNLNQTKLGIIQCKTNWNDNAQIPMLWDYLYRSAEGVGKESNLKVGLKDVSVASFSSFTFAFVTVPTVKRELKGDAVAVNRVNGLSGGNFWGKETQEGVAKSLDNYFEVNLRSAFDLTIQEHIEKYLLTNGLIKSFMDLSFEE